MPEELRVGDRYRPVILMDDVVEVTSMDEGLPRLVLSGRARCRLRLDPGSLAEDEVREAMVEACRAPGITLAGFTGWLQPMPASAGTVTAASEPAEA